MKRSFSEASDLNLRDINRMGGFWVDLSYNTSTHSRLVAIVY